MLTKCLALEYGSSGILCVSVDPGCVTPPLGQGTVSDRRRRATLAWQRPMGIPSWGVPSLGRPFLGTSFPMVILSQRHPFPPASLPVSIPSQALPFPGASLPRCTHSCAAPGSQESCASTAKGQFQALRPKTIQFPPYLFHFPSQLRVSRGHPGPVLGSSRRAAPRVLPPQHPRAFINPNSASLTLPRAGRQGWRQAASCSIAGQVLPPRWLAEGTNESLFLLGTTKLTSILIAPKLGTINLCKATSLGC